MHPRGRLRPRIRGAVVSLPEGNTDQSRPVRSDSVLRPDHVWTSVGTSISTALHAAANGMTNAAGWRGDEAARATGSTAKYGVIGPWDCTLCNCRDPGDGVPRMQSHA